MITFVASNIAIIVGKIAIRTYQSTLFVLWVLWSVGVIYGSLSASEDLPDIGFLAWLPYYERLLPYFDKCVHFGFYFGEMLLLSWLLAPRGVWRWVLWMGVVCLSGGVELLQHFCTARHGEWADIFANAWGALLALGVTCWIDPSKWLVKRG